MNTETVARMIEVMHIFSFFTFPSDITMAKSAKLIQQQLEKEL